MNDLSLKERLDAVWNKNEIAYPNHLVRWSEKQIGSSRFSEFGVYCIKGTLRRPKQKKIKGKGWTWLSKFYGLIWRTKIEAPSPTSRQ